VTPGNRHYRIPTGLLVLLLSPLGGLVRAHDGPPFPIVSNQVAGPYVVSVWTDPDTTDDGSAGGQFWLIIRPSDTAVSLPDATRATVEIWPLDRDGPLLTGRTEPTGRDPGRQFVALVMDHEGRFGVRAAIDGPLGAGAVESEVEATYDLRPAPVMLFVYLAPFLLVGLLWARLIWKRARRP
jgi:hypothetical protein